MDQANMRKALALYASVILGAVWLTVALLAEFMPGFVLFGAFRDLGFAFWIGFTLLGVALVSSLSWSALASHSEDQPRRAAPGGGGPDPVRLTPAWNPMDEPTRERINCLRCARTLPPWRMAEGTCTVCSPYSVFLDKPRHPSPELERRRNRMFLLQGLGIALLALAFVSAVYLFPIVLAPQRPVIATLAFLVFSPLLFGLILLMYARSQAVPEAAE